MQFEKKKNDKRTLISGENRQSNAGNGVVENSIFFQKWFKNKILARFGHLY
jgi:hypothetical protein